MAGIQKYFKEEFLIPAILLIALIVRLCGYSSFSYSNDELSALFRTNYNNYSDLISKGVWFDGHPSGVQTWLYYWVKVFGDSEASVRLPFVILGVASAFLSFLVARRWFNKATGFYAASLIALLQFPLLYSQLARPYSPGLFFSLLMVLAWTKLLFPLKNQGKNKRIFHTIIYGISFAFCMYIHYFSFLFGLIVAATGLIYLKKEQIKYYFSALALSAVLFIPHIPVTFKHLSDKGLSEWLGKPGNDWLWLHIRYIFNNSWFILIICLFIIIVIILTNRKNIRFTRFHLISGILFLMPFIVGFSYSRLVNPVLQNSLLLFSFPFLLIFLFSFANPGYNRINSVLLISLNICLLIDLLFVNPYYKKQHFEEFKGVAKFIDHWNRNAGADQVKQVAVVINPWYLEYYLKKLNYQGSFASFDLHEELDIKELKSIVRNSNSNYFLYAMLKPTSGEDEEIIREKYPYIIDYKNFAKISRVVTYGKECYTGMCHEEKPVYEVRNNFDETDIWEADHSILSGEKFFSKPTSVVLDQKNEYGPAYRIKVSEISKFQSNHMLVSCKALVQSDTSSGILVISIDSPGGRNKYWVASGVKYFSFPGEWSTVYKNFSLPIDIDDNDIIKVYTWNPGFEKLYIDDFDIKFFKREY